MGFLRPELLPLASLASLPIIYHLFLRRIRMKRKLPTLRFLRPQTEERDERRRIRELILLVVRTLALLLLSIAFARPAPPQVAARALAGTRGHAIFLIDRSLSMAAHHAGRTQMEAGVARAIGALYGLLDGTPISIIAFSDEAEVLAERELDRGRVQSLLADLKPLPEGGRLDKALGALRTLSSRNPGPLQVILISDFQRNLFASSGTENLSMDGISATIVAPDLERPSSISNSGIGPVVLKWSGEPSAAVSVAGENDARVRRRISVARARSLPEAGNATDSVIFEADVADKSSWLVPLSFTGDDSVVFRIEAAPTDALMEDDVRVFVVQPPTPVAVSVDFAEPGGEYVTAALTAMKDRVTSRGPSKIFIGDPAGYLRSAGTEPYASAIIFADDESMNLREFLRSRNIEYEAQIGPTSGSSTIRIGAVNGQADRSPSGGAGGEDAGRVLSNLPLSSRLTMSEDPNRSAFLRFSDGRPAATSDSTLTLVGFRPSAGTGDLVLSAGFPVFIRELLARGAPSNSGRILSQNPSSPASESDLRYLLRDEALARLAPSGGSAASSRASDLESKLFDPTMWWRYCLMAVFLLAVAEMVVGSPRRGILV